MAALGAESGISKDEVSRICAGLDETEEAFTGRRLDHIESPLGSRWSLSQWRATSLAVARRRDSSPRGSGMSQPNVAGMQGRSAGRPVRLDDFGGFADFLN